MQKSISICYLLFLAFLVLPKLCAEEAPPVFEVNIISKPAIMLPTGGSINIVLKNARQEISGFNFLITFNNAALTLQNVTPGQYILDHDWKDFEYKYIPQDSSMPFYPNGLVRITASSSQSKNTVGPLPDSNEVLATLQFFAPRYRDYYCGWFKVNFLWTACDDNIIYSHHGDTVYVSNQVYEYSRKHWSYVVLTTDSLLPHFGGVPSSCLYALAESLGKNIYRGINFKNGVILTEGDYMENPLGDVNMNGITYEVGDAECFIEYFLNCNFDAFTVYKDAQIVTSDVDADGNPLTLSDLVYLIRFMVGDARPPKKPLPEYAGNIQIEEKRDELAVRASSNTSIGGLYMNFHVPETEIRDVRKSEDIDLMDLEYNVCMDTLNVIVYSFEKNAAIWSKETDLFEIDYSGKKPQVIDISAANYEGDIIDIDINR